MSDAMDVKAVVRAQDFTGTNLEPSYASRVTITVTPNVDLYKYIKIDSEGNQLVKKVDSEGAAIIVSSISKSRLVSEKWIADIRKLRQVDSKEVEGWPLKKWKTPLIIN